MPQPLTLVGLPAAGKSTIGPRVAAALGRRFVDLDDEIARDAGEPAAVLVARDEPDFRRRESAALVAALGATDAPVIATGGGCAAHGDNAERMVVAGLVVELAVDLVELRRRAVDGPPRPLLAIDDHALAALAARRAPSYRRAHAAVATSGRSVDDVVAAVLEVEATWAALPEDVRRGAVVLSLPGRTYPITIEPGLPSPALLGALLRGSRPVLVIDAEVAAAWPEVAASLGLAQAPQVVVPSGEASKSIDGLARLADGLVAAGADRSSALVAIGGGVTGDLAGFAAATWMRGVPVVHVPTTLVAMTDSAIGGKTAIDLPAGKNLLGAFWQPRGVLCGLGFLSTLPARERRAGFGELWKYALLGGEGTWAAVEAASAWATSPEGTPAPQELVDVIRQAAALKAGVVVRDERETGNDRVLLNLGHTVGHAIESEHGLAHGEAVALGLVAACHVAHALGRAPDSLATRVADALRRNGLAAELPSYLTEATLDRLGVDKKRAGSGVRFVVPESVGQVTSAHITLPDLVTILRRLARG